MLGLKYFLNPDLKVEEQIPKKLLNGAKGIVFLSIVKGAFGIGMFVCLYVTLLTNIFKTTHNYQLFVIINFLFL